MDSKNLDAEKHRVMSGHKKTDSENHPEGCLLVSACVLGN